MFPSSNYQRQILAVSWIGFSVIFIIINSYVNPNFNNSTIFVIISLLCLVTACFLFTRLVDGYLKTRKTEEEERLTNLLEKHGNKKRNLVPYSNLTSTLVIRYYD